LSAPGVESVFGPTWHIVRIRTPYRGERDGKWTAQAVRPTRGFVNGFSSNAFADLFQGAKLVRAQLNRLCAQGCRQVLYYEDEMAHESFEDHNSVYGEALYNETGRRGALLGSIQRPRNAAEFAAALRDPRFDLLVYSSQFTKDSQPYDDALARILCTEQGPRFIISDNRTTGGAQAILRCGGALRGDARNFDLIQRGELLDEDLKLRPQTHVDPFSYELRPTSATAAVQAKTAAGAGAVLAQGTAGREQAFFITALTRSAGRIRPFTYRARNYTFESLHPTFQLPEPYRPEGGYDKVDASVEVTKPARGEGRTVGDQREGTTVGGDALTARQAAIVRAQSGGTAAIPTETQRFTLYDDGTHGDGTRNDRYWEVAVPPEFASTDGEYRFHASFTLCRKEVCVTREATQTVTVEPKLGPQSKVSQQSMPSTGGRRTTRVTIEPLDPGGNPFGPDLLDRLLFVTAGDVKVERKSERTPGVYEAVVSYTTRQGAPRLQIGQFGRPKDMINVPLR
jgi:hypothetical protein